VRVCEYVWKVGKDCKKRGRSDVTEIEISEYEFTYTLTTNLSLTSKIHEIGISWNAWRPQNLPSVKSSYLNIH
jgi:hypothetical protein